MPNSCSVFGCKSNYGFYLARGMKGSKISSFNFPKTEPLRSLWIRNMCTDISGLKKPSVCEKHFEPELIVRSELMYRLGEWCEVPKKFPQLKKGAIPTIFPTIPKHLRAATASIVNCEKDERHVVVDLKGSIVYDGQCSPGILEIVTQYIISKDYRNWVYLSKDGTLTLCFMDTFEECPKVAGCVVIDSAHVVTVYVRGVRLGWNDMPFQINNKIDSYYLLDALLKFVEFKYLHTTQNNCEHGSNVEKA